MIFGIGSAVSIPAYSSLTAIWRAPAVAQLLSVPVLVLAHFLWVISILVMILQTYTSLALASLLVWCIAGGNSMKKTGFIFFEGYAFIGFIRYLACLVYYLICF